MEAEKKGDFPSGLVVKKSTLQCRGHGPGTQQLEEARVPQRGPRAAKKKKKQKKWKRKPILGGFFLVINISKGLNLKYIFLKIRSSLFLKIK